jgi:hypothetical protein
MKKPYGIVYLTSQRVEDGSLLPRYVGLHRPNNTPRSKIYVGSGVLMSRAVKKYGRAAFSRETLQLCYSREELNEAEKFWINKLGALNGYPFLNLSEGGQSCANLNGVEVHRYSLEGDYIDTFSNAVIVQKELGLNAASVLKATDSKYKTNHSVGGFQFRRFKAEKIESVAGTCEKPVVCYTLSGEFIRNFDTATKGARHFKAQNAANIIACCKGKRAAASGCQWRYRGHTDEVVSVEKITKLRNQPILQFIRNTDIRIGSYPSAEEAAKALGCNSETIRQSIRDGRATRLHSWKYDS